MSDFLKNIVKEAGNEYASIVDDGVETGDNLEFIDTELLKNRYYSVNHRSEILDYAKTFDWPEVIKNYYIPAIEKIISK